jgi:hypothetical protein
MKKETISFDLTKLAELKRAYRKACLLQATSFYFEGREYLIDYARYLIEYVGKRL